MNRWSSKGGGAFSYVLFPQKPPARGDKYAIKQKSHDNYTMEESDCRVIDALRTLLAEGEYQKYWDTLEEEAEIRKDGVLDGVDDAGGDQLAAATAGNGNVYKQHMTRKIKDIIPATDVYFDCLCRVVASDFEKGETTKKFKNKRTHIATTQNIQNAVAGPSQEDDDFDSEEAFQAIYVWDGTDALPFPYSADYREEESNVGVHVSAATAPEGEGEGDQGQVRYSNLAAKFPPLDNCIDPLYVLGTALPVIIRTGTTEIALPQVGSWIKLRNLVARVVDGQLQGVYTSRSKWSHISPPSDQAMMPYRIREDGKQVSEWAPASPVAWYSETKHEDKDFVSLRQVLSEAHLPHHTQYRVLVRLMEYTPKAAAKMAVSVSRVEVVKKRRRGSPGSNGGGGVGFGGVRMLKRLTRSQQEQKGEEDDDDNNNNNNNNNKGGKDNKKVNNNNNNSKEQWTWLFMVLLEDATARMTAALFGDDADAFLGIPACNVAENNEVYAHVEEKFHVAMGKYCLNEGGPWMDVCIRSFFTDPSDPAGSRKYAIIDTALRDDVDKKKE